MPTNRGMVGGAHPTTMTHPPPNNTPGDSPKPFLGVKFACCGAYTRIYRHCAGATYRGRCPRCGTPVTFKVGEGGTSSRFFIVQ